MTWIRRTERMGIRGGGGGGGVSERGRDGEGRGRREEEEGLEDERGGLGGEGGEGGGEAGGKGQKGERGGWGGWNPFRQTTSFIDNPIEAGILLRGNGALQTMEFLHYQKRRLVPCCYRARCAGAGRVELSTCFPQPADDRLTLTTAAGLLRGGTPAQTFAEQDPERCKTTIRYCPNMANRNGTDQTPQKNRKMCRVRLSMSVRIQNLQKPT